MPKHWNRSVLRVEQLEDRVTPTVYTVTSLADNIARDGGVTLREAITAINTHRPAGSAPAGSYGTNTIRFSLPGGGNHVIYLRSALPTINGPVVIDGTSQPGYNGRPVVQIDGSYAGSGANGLVIAGGSSTVRGLLVNHFGGDAIVLSSSHNTVAGVWVGIDSTGYHAAGNGNDGIRVTGSSNVIGGSTAADRVVISGNKAAGIELSGTSAWGNTVAGCYVGTDANGFASQANGTGILIRYGASSNTIGGLSQSARNVITGNRLDEIEISGHGTSNNRIQGNFIGADASGSAAALSGRDGVRIDSGAGNNVIGGTAVGAGNLISGAGHLAISGSPPGAGVNLTGYGTTGNIVQGNWIGLNSAGLAALGNLGGGILIQQGASGNTVGGRDKRSQNVISDRSNSSGVSSTNQMLPAYWYIDSIKYLNNPGLLGGTFIPVRKK